MWRRLKRQFENGPHVGTIISVDTDDNDLTKLLWRVGYLDGDCEDLHDDEVTLFVASS